jgi:ureidoglycolate hydrolase
MAGLRILTLEPQPLTPEAFAPFGVLPPDEGDAPTADLEFRLNDGWVNYIGHTLDEVEVVDGALRCDMLNRHDTHTQTLMPLSGDSIIVVAPADVPLTADDELATVQAFVVRRYECVHLRRGTWHWGPYPIGAESVRVFNIQGRGYPNDNGVATFAKDLGVVFAIQTVLS